MWVIKPPPKKRERKEKRKEKKKKIKSKGSLVNTGEITKGHASVPPPKSHLLLISNENL